MEDQKKLANTKNGQDSATTNINLNQQDTSIEITIVNKQTGNSASNDTDSVETNTDTSVGHQKPTFVHRILVSIIRVLLLAAVNLTVAS